MKIRHAGTQSESSAEKEAQMKCAKCGFECESFARVKCSRPFTAYNPMEGLNAWGPWSAEKQIICQVGQYIHFIVEGEHRLVKMDAG